MVISAAAWAGRSKQLKLESVQRTSIICTASRRSRRQMTDGSGSLLGVGSTAKHTRFDARQCGATQPTARQRAGRGSAGKDLMDGIAANWPRAVHVLRTNAGLVHALLLRGIPYLHFNVPGSLILIKRPIIMPHGLQDAQFGTNGGSSISRFN